MCVVLHLWRCSSPGILWPRSVRDSARRCLRWPLCQEGGPTWQSPQSVWEALAWVPAGAGWPPAQAGTALCHPALSSGDQRPRCMHVATRAPRGPRLGQHPVSGRWVAGHLGPPPLPVAWLPMWASVQHLGWLGSLSVRAGRAWFLRALSVCLRNGRVCGGFMREVRPGPPLGLGDRHLLKRPAVSPIWGPPAWFGRMVVAKCVQDGLSPSILS